MADKAAAEGEVPYLSFNSDITNPADLNPPVAADAKKKDPKLGDTWSLWEQPLGAAENQDLREVCTFSSVKEFWAVWNHVPQPSILLDGKRWTRIAKDGKKEVIDKFMVFRKGIKPQWEDPKNENGGEYRVELKPDIGGGTIDELWNNVVLGVVGEIIDPAEFITGVRFLDKLGTKKPCLRIELWFEDYTEENKKFALRGNLERMLRTRLDGSEGIVTWGRTQIKNHRGMGN
eukprot:gb/GFBE01077808.1/.p1 GENE.gb/GFBE01077808.1/~~gb/GFBE01077808.1/.p1  ORF type:complete len:232 (+),score=62.85 gb/GFBE01077808.1/:1-696(+)